MEMQEILSTGTQPDILLQGLRRNPDNSGFLRLQNIWRRDKKPTSLPEILKDRPLSEVVVGFYQCWDDFQGGGIIDTDVSGINARPIWGNGFKNPEQVSQALSATITLQQQALAKADASNSWQTEQLVMLGEDLSASATFLPAFIQPGDPVKFIPDTMGVRMRRIGKRKMAKLEAEIAGQLSVYANCHEDTLPASMEKYRRDFKSGPEEIKDGIIRHVDASASRLIDYLGLPDVSSEFGDLENRFKFVNEPEEWWRMDASAKYGVPSLTINRGRPFFVGQEQTYAYHEVLTHMLNVLLLKHNVQSGEVEGYHAIRSEHRRQAFASEGVAQTLPFFLPPGVLDINGLGYLATNYGVYQQVVYNNGFLEAYRLIMENPDRAITRGVNYLVSHLGESTRDDAERDFKARLLGEKPISRTYSLIYGRAADEHLEGSRLLDEQGKKMYLQRYFGKPLTPQYAMALLGRGTTEL